LGFASVNTISALTNGAVQAEVTLNGIGERAGNCALEEIAAIIAVRGKSLNLSHSINMNKLWRSSQRVYKLTGLPVPVNKPVVGSNAFVHKAGIHQHGVLKNPATYEIISAKSIGKPEASISLGKLSGRHAFVEKIEELGLYLPLNEVDDAFAEFKLLCDRKKQVTDEDLEALIGTKNSEVPDFYKLVSFQIQSGNTISSVACVTISTEDGEKSEAAVGDGPVDAAAGACMRIVGGEWNLISYDIKAVTGGLDALGEVTVRVENNGSVHTGRGLSTDIIEASILAYINAINRATALRKRMQK
jgi:2-isopropylmalate synthase